MAQGDVYNVTGTYGFINMMLDSKRLVNNSIAHGHQLDVLTLESSPCFEQKTECSTSPTLHNIHSTVPVLQSGWTPILCPDLIIELFVHHKHFPSMFGPHIYSASFEHSYETLSRVKM
jgi:hypothetical protein